MSYTRSAVRYNCFCKRKGNEGPDRDIIEIIEKQLNNYTWSQFTDEWDVAVFPDRITVIPNVKDISRVVEVCTYAHIAIRSGVGLEHLSDADMAIVHMIESQFLEDKMNWVNFRQNWGVRWEPERKRVETYLLNVPSGQIEVTPELIQQVLDRSGVFSRELYETIAVNLSKEE